MTNHYLGGSAGKLLGRSPRIEYWYPSKEKRPGLQLGVLAPKPAKHKLRKRKQVVTAREYGPPKCVRHAMHPKERPEKLKMKSFSDCVAFFFFFFGGGGGRGAANSRRNSVTANQPVPQS